MSKEKEVKRTAFEFLQEKLTIEDTVSFRTMHLPEILSAMEKYANQETTALKKENEELRATVGEMGDLLKENLKEAQKNMETTHKVSALFATYEKNRMYAEHIKSILNKAGITV